MAFRILLAGGGSGGHIYPLSAIAEEIQRLSPQYHRHVRLRFIGAGDILAREAKRLGISHRRVLAPKWRRYGSWRNAADLLKVPFALIQSIFLVWIWMPDVVLVKGGYAAFFPALAARLLLVPIVVHESDSIPGKTNLYWGKHARRVFVAFENAAKYFRADRVELVGNPIRSLLLQLPAQPQARALFGLSENKPVVFITGGSQGAQALNDIISLSILELVKTYSVIHQCGAGHEDKLLASVAPSLHEVYKVYGTLDADQMARAYAAADVIVSRAGSAIFEIAAAGKPAVLIPLDGAAQDHQTVNAQEFAKHGAIVLPQSNLAPHLLIQEIARAFDQRATLGPALKKFARPDAATRIAKELLGASTL